tara:strand:+ start:1347 stop:2057 length:711 start_codon:yes stop_codon:yes gene_type:complete
MMAEYSVSKTLNGMKGASQKTITSVANGNGFCCGFLKFSYVVSAPLHTEGLWGFWRNPTIALLDRTAVTTDVFLHLSFWIGALILEIMAISCKDRGNDMLVEMQEASLYALITALVGILIAQVFALWGNQDAGRLFPSTYALIVGGAYTSIIFSIMWTISTTNTWVPGMLTQYTDDSSENDDLKNMRQCILWALALKIFAVTTLIKNASFWGPCKVDKEAEAMEQVAAVNGEMSAL